MARGCCWLPIRVSHRNLRIRLPILRVLGQHSAHGIEEEVEGLNRLAAYDHELRIEDADEVRRAEAEHVAGIVEHTLRSLVTVTCSAHHLAEVWHLCARRHASCCRSPADRRGRGVPPEAAVLPAVALWSVVEDAAVTDLAREPAGADDDLA